MIGRKLELKYLADDSWYDKDFLMMHFSFELLCRFVEDEMKKDSSTNWEKEPRKSAKQEIMKLYNWWLLYKNSTDDNYKLENTQLSRLIKIREFMWT